MSDLSKGQQWVIIITGCLSFLAIMGGFATLIVTVALTPSVHPQTQAQQEYTKQQAYQDAYRQAWQQEENLIAQEVGGK